MLFPKFNKISVHISTVRVTHHWAKTKLLIHNYVTIVVWWVEFEKKNRFVCTRWLSVHMKSAIEQGFCHEFAFDNKALKTFVEFQIWWKRSKFERRRIRIRTSSHPYFFAHCCHYHYRFLLLSLGCYPLEGVTLHLFYLSDLVSPLFFVNLPTIFSLRVSPPLEGVTRGSAP